MFHRPDDQQCTQDRTIGVDKLPTDRPALRSALPRRRLSKLAHTHLIFLPSRSLTSFLPLITKHQTATMDGQQQHQWQRSTFVLRLPNDEAAVVAEGLLVQHDPRYVVTYRCIVSIVACSLSLLRPFCHPLSTPLRDIVLPHINTRN